mmetsp:Transcript_14877/g.28392  ORF Transcript_14877/g.28392 Transcript_14877/m.28392 type:complete len:207 (+) Transcript_14877:673-1293(+)|eukprot:scaffold4855_cov195-Amphora_coffeaeformis.AAC.6
MTDPSDSRAWTTVAVAANALSHLGMQGLIPFQVNMTEIPAGVLGNEFERSLGVVHNVHIVYMPPRTAILSVTRSNQGGNVQTTCRAVHVAPVLRPSTHCRRLIVAAEVIQIKTSTDIFVRHITSALHDFGIKFIGMGQKPKHGGIGMTTRGVVVAATTIGRIVVLIIFCRTETAIAKDRVTNHVCLIRVVPEKAISLDARGTGSGW